MIFELLKCLAQKLLFFRFVQCHLFGSGMHYFNLHFFVAGGAGGKGTWGKLGCELELPWVDPNDPNYESDGEQVRGHS